MSDARQMQDLTRAINELVGAIGGADQGFRRVTTSAERASDATEAQINGQRRLSESEQQQQQQQNNAKRQSEEIARRVSYEASRAVEHFKNAVMSADTSLSKYNNTLSSASDIIGESAKGMGLFGKGMALLAQGALKLAQLQLKQADDLLKGTDALAKIGSAGQISTKELINMGHSAGYASQRLEGLIKPIQSLGSSVLGLGLTAAEGQKKFAAIASLGKDAESIRSHFRAMGISQEELTQAQADYVKMQVETGNRINKPIDQLRKSSLEYVENLTTLSAITGEDIETIKKRQQAAQSEIETMIANNLLDQKIAALRLRGETVQADKLQKQKDAMGKTLGDVGAVIGDPKITKGLASFFASGAANEFSTSLINSGVPLEKFRKRIIEGEDVTADLLDALRKNGQAVLRQVGYSGMLDEQTREQFGITKEFLQWLAKNPDATTEEQIKAAKEAQAKLEAEGDNAQKARNLMLESEIKVQVGFDQIVAATNPLVSGFNATTAAVTALQAAAMTTAAVLGAKAFIGGLRSIAGLATGGSGLTAGSGLAAAGLGAAAATTAAAGAMAVGVGTALYSAAKFSQGQDASNWASDLAGVENWRFGDEGAEEQKQAEQKQKKSTNQAYIEALAGTGYTYDLDKGGLQKDNKRVPITEAPDDIKAIVSKVAEERRKAPKMAMGGILGANQIGMVGEAGPEFITGPGKVVSVKDTEKLLGAALRNGLGPFTTLNRSSSNRPQEALLERNMRDLNSQKEKELENLTDSNESMETMNTVTGKLTNTFKEFQEQLGIIFNFSDDEEEDTPTPPGGGGGGGGGGAVGGYVDPATKEKAISSPEGKKALAYFRKQGWTKAQASGIVANLMAESGANLQTTAVGDRGKAYGIAQWHPDRQAYFKKLYGKDIRESTLEEQLEFVQQELKSNEIKAGQLLSQATTPEQAAAIIDKYYERSSGAHRGRRIGLSTALADASEVVEKTKAETTEVAASSPSPTVTPTTNTSTDTTQIAVTNAQGFTELSDKLSTMIAKLEENNEILSRVKQNTG